MVAGRRRDRLEELVTALPTVKVHPLVADLGTDAGVEAVADVCDDFAPRRMISAVQPDKPASNFQQRDNALAGHLREAG